MVVTLVMAPKSVTFRQHDHLVSVLFGDLLSHSYNITFSMFLTRGASGYSSLLGNLSVYVSLDRQNPHLAFKTLQYHNMRDSFDTL